MKKILFLLFTAIILSAFTSGDASEWKLTDGYSIRFKGKKVNGFFRSMKGQVNFDENTLSSSRVMLEVDATSITTQNSLKTWHSKRAKWFDTKKFPTITFNSNKF